MEAVAAGELIGKLGALPFCHGGTAICDPSTTKAVLIAEPAAIRELADALPR